MSDPASVYEFFDHAADVGIRAQARTREGLFAAMAAGLMEWIGPPPRGGAGCVREISLQAETDPDLLVRWLQELLFLFGHEHFYACHVQKMQLAGGRLKASVHGRAWSEENHADYREVKAVTYHRLRLEPEGSGWGASVILDV